MDRHSFQNKTVCEVFVARQRCVDRLLRRRDHRHRTAVFGKVCAAKRLRRNTTKGSAHRKSFGLTEFWPAVVLTPSGLLGIELFWAKWLEVNFEVPMLLQPIDLINEIRKSFWRHI